VPGLIHWASFTGGPDAHLPSAAQIHCCAGGAAAWPLSARAQQAAKPVIGFINTASPAPYAPFLSAFHKGLKEVGYVEGQNLAIEYRWAEGQYDRLPAMAADLVSRRVVGVLEHDRGRGPQRHG
jgi:hypothetical protein